jgi:hypothetical protein
MIFSENWYALFRIMLSAISTYSIRGGKADFAALSAICRNLRAIPGFCRKM